MILSPDEKIDDLVFYAMPTKPTKVTKAMRVGEVTICVGENGRLYTNSRLAGKYAFTVGSWPWLEGTLQGLLKLGVVTKEQVDAHMRAVEKADTRMAKQIALQDLERIEKEFGIEFTAKQKKAVSV